MWPVSWNLFPVLEIPINARERLAAAALWLGSNHEDLSDGLCNAFDGLRLYDYAQAHDQLPEMADTGSPQTVSRRLATTRSLVCDTRPQPAAQPRPVRRLRPHVYSGIPALS